MEGGGAERVAALLSNAWAGKGHDVILMPTFSGRGGCVYTLSGSVQLIFLSDLIEQDSGKFSRLAALRAFIKTEAPDVIISFLPHVNCAAILAAWGLRIPVIASERSYPPLSRHLLSRPYRLLRRILYPAAAALVGQTEVASKWLRARARRTAIATIANPVILPLPVTEPSVAPEIVVGKERKLILWAGRLGDEKRPDILIDAFSRMAAEAPDWDVAMLGDGPLRNAMQERIEARGMNERIFLPGFVGNLSDWYRRAELFVMTSSFEGFPNTLLEAMAHGTASIAFDVPTGPAELSAKGRRLHLLPDNDQVSRLAEALADLTFHDTIRQAFAHTAAETRQTYSMTAILAQWDALFRTVQTNVR